MMAALPIFWAIPPTFLSGIAVAAGLALINSVANIGGWFGPTLFGLGGAWAMAGYLGVGCGLSLLVNAIGVSKRG